MVDGLSEQIEKVQNYQMGVMWEYYVYEYFKNYSSNVGRGRDVQGKRMRDLLLSMPASWCNVEFRTLKQEVYHTHYSGKTQRTLQRDLKEVLEMGLVERSSVGYRAKREIVSGMLPLKAK